MNIHITISELIGFILFTFIIIIITSFALVALMEANNNHNRYNDTDREHYD